MKESYTIETYTNDDNKLIKPLIPEDIGKFLSSKTLIPRNNIKILHSPINDIGLHKVTVQITYNVKLWIVKK